MTRYSRKSLQKEYGPFDTGRLPQEVTRAGNGRSAYKVVSSPLDGTISVI